MKSDPIQSELLKSSTNPIRTRSGRIGSGSDSDSDRIRTPLICTWAIEVSLACACVFATKTLRFNEIYFEVRKMANSWRDLFTGCAPVSLGGTTDSDKVSFYLLIHVKFT